MKWTKEDIQRIRDIPIAREMGLPLGRRVMIRCPMADHNDNTASFLIDQENKFKCFGCNAKGAGFIDFATQFMISRGEVKDEKEAFKKIMEEYNN